MQNHLKAYRILWICGLAFMLIIDILCVYSRRQMDSARERLDKMSAEYESMKQAYDSLNCQAIESIQRADKLTHEALIQTRRADSLSTLLNKAIGNIKVVGSHRATVVVGDGNKVSP
jgi:hypothetical protein